MAVTVATGFLVDDAIVVMENTMRHIEGGMPRMRAALYGAREVGFTVLAMSLALCAVFIPFELMGGIIGKLFGEFFITLTVAILISLVLSLTTTAMLCSRLLPNLAYAPRPASPARQHWFDRFFNALRREYELSLPWALRHPWSVIGSLFGVIVLSVALIIIVPKGFFPQQDTGQLVGGLRTDSFASFPLIKRKLQEVAKIIQDDPAVDSVTGSVGGG
jgi:multidrug efflux pump